MISVFCGAYATAQNDTIIVDQDHIVLGKVKSMNRGVLKMETSFSKNDFEIEWLEIKGITTASEFSVSTTDGVIYSGRLNATADQNVAIISSTDTLATVPISSVVYLRSLKSDFWSRMSASVAIGYYYTKANDYNQFSLRSTLEYQEEKWTLNGNFNGIYTDQSDTEALRRLDAAVSYRYFLKNDWFPLAEINMLSNSEQNIKLRAVTRVGMGKYIVRTNQLYWGMQAGVSYNNESYTIATTAAQNSLEGFLGTEFNMYDLGDISLLTKVIAYPGITESGRLRLDGSFDMQYDLPLDFFIKLGFTVNYDNKAITQSTDLDYVIQTSFGWEL